MAHAWLGLGTNLGEREANLARAIAALQALGTIEAVSSVYESEPVGFLEQPAFWNLVLRLSTDLSPEELLAAAKEIEVGLGRRPSFRNAPRVIDIDLLLYDDAQFTLPDLVVPHPRLLERAFVLRPLVEIDPELAHPVTGESLRERLQQGEFERVAPLFPAGRLQG